MKRVFVGLFTVLLMFFGLAANVYAAGYVCDSAAKYTSCGAGFFMRYNGAYNGTPTTGNICSSCTDYAPRAEFCPGGTYAPAYKVTLNPNGGSGGLAQLYTVKGISWFTSLKKTTGTPATSAAAIGTTISTLSSSQLPTRTGYTFNGFYTAASGGSQIISSAGAITGSNPNGNDQATLYAQWTANTYTIKYDSAGGSAVSNTTCTYGQNCTVSTTKPTKTGYTFNGWKYGSTSYISGQSVSNLTSTNGGSVTFTAQWTANSYTCSAGKYLNITTCETCKAGYYCPGGTRTYDGVTHLMYTCPTGYTSDAGNTAQNKCYVTTTAGNYIANANDSAQTTCSENNYCPGGVKVTYGSTGGANTCPDPSTHKPTVLPGSDYVFDDGRTAYAFWINVGLSDINRCAAVYGFTTNAGYVTYEGVRYDSSAGKYGMTTSSIYWSRVNPGYYLKTRYLDDYCSSNTSRSMLYREVSTCPAGSYCPGGSVPGCSSGTYNDTFGVYTCPENSTSSAGSSYCTCKNGYLANGSLTTTTTACTPFVPEVKITTVDNPEAFTFSLTAKGTFYVDLGDGSAIKVINKTNTNLESFTYELIGSKSYVIGISGQATEYNSASNMAAITFNGNTNIKSLSGSLGAIFGTLSNGSQPRFFQSFYNSTNLESIPSTLFDGITGQPVSNMFRSTFEGTALKTVPAGLFGGLDGSPASALFNATFAQCKSLTTIPSGLFGGIYGKPAGYMFADTFAGCSNLETVPSDLFARISGAPADYMYNNTFWGCSKLNFTIPSNFFGTFNGVPTERMFNSTFEGCSSLNSEIPSDLFAGISGAPNTRMFRRMFYACSKVHGDIPNDLFAGISKTTTATDQMTEVFTGSGLITSCPAGEYQYMTGFESYFGGKVSCTPCPNGYDDGGAGLTAINQCQMTVESGKYIATSGADTVTNCPVNNMCPGGKVNYTDTGIISTCPANSSSSAGASVCKCNDGYVTENGAQTTTQACELFEPKFTATTISNTSSFDFSISAAGKFYVDWGDDSDIQVIERSDTGYLQSYSHTYSTPGSYEIKLSGKATGYSSYYEAISFSENSDLAKIDGSLGAIFSTLDDGSQPLFGSPRFHGTFFRCYNLSGEIPANLFEGITGQPVAHMFMDTFNACPKLEGPIPKDLFAGLNGNVTPYLFYGTFGDCTGLTGDIPQGLFSGIKGVPQTKMFQATFYNCPKLEGPIPKDLFAGIDGEPQADMFWLTFGNDAGLTGSIPENLFENIKGAPANGMFFGTFYGCSGLTGTIPEGLFAKVNGDPADQAFENTFYGTSGLSGFVPNNLFAGISQPDVATATDQMTNVFTASGLGVACPAGEYQYMTGFESYFDGKVSCAPCPNGYDDGDAGLTAINQCQMTVESGKYIATSGADTVTNCPVNNICPGGKVNYTDTGIISTCPANSSTNGATGQAICTCNTGYNYNGGTSTTTNACVTNTYTIKYNTNGGDGSIADTTCTYGQNCTISSTKPTKTGYTFTGWQYGLTTYQSGSTIDTNLTSTNGAVLEFVAQWTPITYTVRYDANGGDGSIADTTCTYGQNCTISSTKPTKTGYTFNGWKYGITTYQAGSTIDNSLTSTNGDTVTFTAKWEPITYIIRYDADGGSGSMADTTCTYDQICYLSKNTYTKTGHRFVGWWFMDYMAGEYVTYRPTQQDEVVVAKAYWLPIQISCPAGQYLDGLYCIDCEDEYYCEGSEADGWINGWVYDGGIHGRTDCPAVTNKYGAAIAYNGGLLDETRNSSVNQCRALFAYLPKWFADLGETEFDGDDLDWNANNRGYYVVDCKYNTTTQQYDSDCRGYATFCDTGYVSNFDNDILDVQYGNIDIMSLMVYASNPQEAINNICVPVGYNNWSAGAEQCVSLPEEEIEKCMFSDTNITHACPDGGVTLTDTAGSIEECMLPVVECSTEVGTGVRSCMYEEETGAYTNCDLCSVSSCYSGLYMNNGVCVTCPAGSACSDNNITTCGANTWTETNSAQCNACPANSSTNGATGQTQCVCNDGYTTNGKFDGPTTTTTQGCIRTDINVTYDVNGGNGALGGHTCPAGTQCTLLTPDVIGNQMYRAGYVFIGWGDKANATTPVNPVFNTDVTLYAIWNACAAGTYKTADAALDAQCSACQVLGDKQYNATNGVASTGPEQCFTTCANKKITNATLFPKNTTAYYPNVCEYENGITDNGNPCKFDGDTCKEVSCKPDNEMINGNCQPCNREHATEYKTTGNCEVAKCRYGYHPNGQSCQSDVIECQMQNAKSASQKWDEQTGAYGICTITECEPGFHIVANACQPDEQTCELEHGIGWREWDDKKNDWGKCIATQCEPGYTNDPDLTNESWEQCGRCNNMYGAHGERVVSSYVRECEIASCMYQGEHFILENNECRDICETYSDETGSRKWNGNKCVHTCNEGYTNW